MCDRCTAEARRFLASPWVRAARARWPRADILNDGRFAVIGCAERRISLLRDKAVAKVVAAPPDQSLCDSSCTGQHAVVELNTD
jgi:hypothetical protein